MARRGSSVATCSPSGPTAGRVRQRRSKSANEATRALLANVAALEALSAKGAGVDRLDSKGWALRYLETSRPTSVLAPAPLSAADQAKLASAQADHIVGVIRAVLEGLNLSDADYTRGLDLAIEELRASSAQGWEPL
jgi:hypothetical protein